jgi:fructose-1,6-bisphosphatase I
VSYRETLKHFIMRQQTQITGATGEFTLLLDDVSSACKGVANLVRRGELSGELGAAVGINVQDENQKKLDVMANELAISWCEQGGQLFAMASEEMVDVYPVPNGLKRGNYLLIFDPLDGSSNIEQFPAKGRSAVVRGLRSVRAGNHDGADHRKRRERFHTQSRHR